MVNFRTETIECSSVIAHCHIKDIECVTKGCNVGGWVRVGFDELVIVG